MSDKGWLCIVCGHYIHEQSPNELALEGGRAHKYCLEAEKVGAADERERIINLLEDPNTLGAWWSNPEVNIGLYGNLKNFVIALIKGEQE